MKQLHNVRKYSNPDIYYKLSNISTSPVMNSCKYNVSILLVKVYSIYISILSHFTFFYRKHIECSMCRFATSCSIAYANHMMGFHSGQMSSLNLNIPWERKMKCHLYCLCGYGSRYGNNIGKLIS